MGASTTVASTRLMVVLSFPLIELDSLDKAMFVLHPIRRAPATTLRRCRKFCSVEDLHARQYIVSQQLCRFGRR